MLAGLKTKAPRASLRFAPTEAGGWRDPARGGGGGGGIPGGRSRRGGTFCRAPPHCCFLLSLSYMGWHTRLSIGLVSSPGPPAPLHEVMESRFQRHVHPGRSSAPAPSVAPCGFQAKVLPRAHPGSRPQRSCPPSGLCLGARACPPGSLQPGVMLSRPTVLCRLWAPRRLAHTVEALGAGLLNGRKGRSAPWPPREMRDQRR